MTHASDDEPASPPIDARLRHARQRCEGLRILSTLPFHRYPDWTASVVTLAPRRRPLHSLWRWTDLTDPWLVLRLLWHARRCDAVLLNGGERVDLVYLALAVALIVSDHRGGWLAEVRARATVAAQPLWWMAGLPARIGDAHRGRGADADGEHERDAEHVEDDLLPCELERAELLGDDRETGECADGSTANC